MQVGVQGVLQVQVEGLFHFSRAAVQAVQEGLCGGDGRLVTLVVVVLHRLQLLVGILQQSRFVHLESVLLV